MVLKLELGYCVCSFPQTFPGWLECRRYRAPLGNGARVLGKFTEGQMYARLWTRFLVGMVSFPPHIIHERGPILTLL